MLRSAVFKDIELSIQSNNENLFEEEKKTMKTETKKSPVKVPIAKSVSKDLTEKEEKRNGRWKSVFVDVNEEESFIGNKGFNDELVLKEEEGKNTTPLRINIDESLARSRDLINITKKTSTPTQTTPGDFKIFLQNPRKLMVVILQAVSRRIMRQQTHQLLNLKILKTGTRFVRGRQ